MIGLDASDAQDFRQDRRERGGGAGYLEKIPAPNGDPEAPASGVDFDSIYDSYKGVIISAASWRAR